MSEESLLYASAYLGVTGAFLAYIAVKQRSQAIARLTFWLALVSGGLFTLRGDQLGQVISALTIVLVAVAIARWEKRQATEWLNKTR